MIVHKSIMNVLQYMLQVPATCTSVIIVAMVTSLPRPYNSLPRLHSEPITCHDGAYKDLCLYCFVKEKRPMLGQETRVVAGCSSFGQQRD